MLKSEKGFKVDNELCIFLVNTGTQNLYMKTTRTILLLLIPCFFLAMTCIKKDTEHCHHKVYMNNHTDKPVYAMYSFNYPDTSITFQNPALFPNNYKIDEYGRKAIYSERTCIEYMIQHDNPAEVFTVFVFDAEVLETTPWEQVKQNYMVLKRYDYSLDELRNTDFSIDFP